MKIISGKYRGLNLKTLEGLTTRPMGVRIKENMFNILDNYFIYQNKIMLEPFGGSGAISLECLSRGIGYVVINDLNPDAVKIIDRNFSQISETNYQIFNLDYNQLFTNFMSQRKKFDLIILDPPFKEVEYYHQIIKLADQEHILNEWGIIIVQSDRKLDFSYTNKLKLLKYKNYGNKHLYFWRLEWEENGKS